MSALSDLARQLADEVEALEATNVQLVTDGEAKDATIASLEAEVLHPTGDEVRAEMDTKLANVATFMRGEADEDVDDPERREAFLADLGL